MSAPQVTEAFVDAIRQGYDLIVTNYANPDMVGHTGDLQAAIRACEAVDQGLGRGPRRAPEGGRRDDRDRRPRQLRDDGGPRHRRTAHVAHDEPGAGDRRRRAPGSRLRDGRLADLAPTLLDLMGIGKPPEMTGESLLS
jgi:2,3-bisphosphoglycerate-independent phosphoglycerate mutase